MKRWVWSSAVLLVGLLAVASATEQGGGAYQNGAEGLMTGAVPPPGQYLLNYVLYYNADDLIDGNGDKIPVDFDATVWADLVRVLNVSKVQILGASWAQQIFVPVVSLDLTTPGGEDDALGLGDIIVDPFVLAWHRPPFHWVAGLDVYLPTGDYDKDEIANIGRNVWTFEPVAALTWLNQQGYELSAKFMYDINTENTDTDYQSGDEFHVDFVAARHMGNWAAGAGGFYYQQVTGDDGMTMTPAGPADAGDNKGAQIGLGPQFSHQYKGMGFILAADYEFETENRPEGERYWFKFITEI